MTPIHVKSTSYTDLNVENKEKDPKFTVDDHVRISKYKNIFAQCYTPNWSEEVFIVKKVKNIKPQKYVTKDFINEEIVGTFYERELQKANQIAFKVEKVIKKKGKKLCVPQKGYNNSFNSLFDKKNIV